METLQPSRPWPLECPRLGLQRQIIHGGTCDEASNMKNLTSRHAEAGSASGESMSWTGPKRFFQLVFPLKIYRYQQNQPKPWVLKPSRWPVAPEKPRKILAFNLQMSKLLKWHHLDNEMQDGKAWWAILGGFDCRKVPVVLRRVTKMPCSFPYPVHDNIFRTTWNKIFLHGLWKKACGPFFLLGLIRNGGGFAVSEGLKA